MKETTYQVAIAGNPNCGKTTIFNHLTGARQHVGNWPGVTVERKTGLFKLDGERYETLDLPGTYSLSSYSQEERIAAGYLIDESPDLVLNVVDASNLERNLLLTSQLIELGLPMVIVLNMMDMAREKGLEIDLDTLGTLLGAPVVGVIGRNGQGMDELRQKIRRVIHERSQKQRRLEIPYARDIEAEIQLISELEMLQPLHEHQRRWTVIKLLEGDRLATERWQDPVLQVQVAEAVETLEKRHQETIRGLLTNARFGFIQGALRECVRQLQTDPRDISREIDKILTNRYLGLPIFALIMWTMFKLTYDIGSYPMDWIDGLVASLMDGLHALLPSGMFTSLVVDGAIGGVGAIAVFLPNIFILFFLIALLEDSGYMARVAFIMDRIMHNMGLHGKAFIPMVMGFGCNVPAIMGTRILETRRDRLLTILINPFMSCSARLPVYVLVAGAFFPEQAALVIFAMYMLGILAAIASGKLFSQTILAGKSRPFVLELPTYQRPTLRSLGFHTWERGSLFIRKMGTVILVGSVLVWALGSFPREVDLSRDYTGLTEDVEADYRLVSHQIESDFDMELAKLQAPDRTQDLPPAESLTILVENRDSLLEAAEETRMAALMHIDAERVAEITSQRWIGRVGQTLEPLLAPLGFTWREGVALVTGFVAKEIVVSTYGVLFGVGGEATESNPGVIQSLRMSGMTPAVALAFMVFTLLYTPCLATVAAIRRETGSWGYTGFSVGYSLGLAYVLALVALQLGEIIL